ncbi:MAG: PIN domain-containing protein [Hyphomicrobiales bacterium]
MTAPFFVDSNLLVYVADAAIPSKQERAEKWIAALWRSRLGRLSVQVLNEYYVTVTQRLVPPMQGAEARRHVDALMAWKPAPVDEFLVRHAWTVQDRFGFSWWDCLIVAAAQTQGCRYLVTEDMQHGQELNGVTVISPFRADPDEFPEITARR